MLAPSENKTLLEKEKDEERSFCEEQDMYELIALSITATKIELLNAVLLRMISYI